MPDPGKAARVIGFFVFQLGVAIMLDSRADVWGGVAALGGSVVFVWGMLQIAGTHRQPIGHDSPGGAARC